ncbi:hypothetical protein GDO86_019067 [Hymenochirus boettgeri]|uniref:WAP domain-containing protein n=1 Tax=Hymenochirus boettgeri TaxID=247094 RepID=A0A8T2IKI5_9PIPI|nr:hypothetical protein GDO86_019067 [Hymenochirus boettgeri]
MGGGPPGPNWDPPLKPGKCPADVDYSNCDNLKYTRCSRDIDCESSEKCCPYGCAKICRLPVQEKNATCPFFDASRCPYMNALPNECYSDDQCPGTERCCCFNCRRQCTRTQRVKPGQCPPAALNCPAVLPKPNCTTDADCKENQKCCDSCGRKCVEPEKERDGFCPQSTENLSCMTCNPKPLCRRDSECRKNWKCCLSDNRIQCVRPLKDKPGQCPIPSNWCPEMLPNPSCDSDRDCPGQKKCCAPACRKECVDVDLEFL